MKNKIIVKDSLKNIPILWTLALPLPLEVMGATDLPATNLSNIQPQLSEESTFSTKLDSATQYDSLISAGNYFVEIYINGTFYTYQNIEFKSHNQTKVEACIPVSMLIKAGVFQDRIEPQLLKQKCVFLDDTIERANSVFDSEKLRLDLNIPDGFIPKTIRNDVPHTIWDEGNNVLFLNYSGNYFNSENRQRNSHDESTYFDLRSGLNLGLWQLRNNSSYRYTPDKGSIFEVGNSYLQRSLPHFRSQLIIGETSTAGRLFAPITFQGLILKSDERMLSLNQQGYAPEIHGSANSNAKVTVKQNDIVIYETSVPPGSFLINDLYSPQNAGDLTVEVTETDNPTYTFIVPFSAVSNSLRPGLSNYALTLGKTNSPYINAEDTDFAELTYERGINNLLTLNIGLQTASNHYVSVASGGVLATPIGAFGIGSAFSRAKIPDGNLRGWQMDSKYSKTFSPTATTLTLTGYRYSTIGYRTLNDSLTYGVVPYYKNNLRTIRSSSYHQRQRFEASLNQKLFNKGSVFATALWQNYYNKNVTNKQYQLGYQNVFNKLSYSLTASRQTRIINNNKQIYNDIFTLSLKLPLGEKAAMTSTVSHYSTGATNLQTGVNGKLGENNNYSYNLNFSRNTSSSINTTSANINHTNAFGLWGAGYSQSGINHSYTANGKGSFVVHEDGILYGPYLSETFGIVKAPGAEGARLMNIAGVKLNNKGYAIVPSLSPYKYNLITLNPQDINDRTELVRTQKRVVPYAGAAPVITFTNRTGKSS